MLLSTGTVQIQVICIAKHSQRINSICTRKPRHTEYIIRVCNVCNWNEHTNLNTSVFTSISNITSTTMGSVSEKFNCKISVYHYRNFACLFLYCVAPFQCRLEFISVWKNCAHPTKLLYNVHKLVRLSESLDCR